MVKTPGLVLTLALALSAPAAAGPVAPQVTDQAGDANALTFPYARGGQVGGIERSFFPEDPFGPGVQTGPASWGPGDLTSARLETTHEAVPVGEDGVDFRATGIRVRLSTVEQPRSAGPTTVYVLGAMLAETGCALFVEVQFIGPASPPSQDPPVSALVQLGNSADTCFADATVRDPRLTVTPDPTGVTVQIPLAAIPEEHAFGLAEGALIETPQAWSEAVSFVPRIDSTLAGRDFRVGEDMPADVPCTIGCP